MLRYRTFRNTDPPLLAALWRSRSGQRGLLQPVSADLFEQLVFGKLHFDYHGMILAFEGEQPVGFVHASFGPADSCHRLCTDAGVVCMLVVRPDCDQPAVAAGLVEQAEAYLTGKGAKVIYGGGLRPMSPFYFGLYGGCEPPGVLESDAIARQAFLDRGYQLTRRTLIFQLSLAEFHATVDRQQQQFRRRMIVQVTVDPPAPNWWTACTMGDFDLTQFELLPRGGGAALARALVRDMAASSAGHGPAAGLIDITVEPDQRRHGLAIYLLGETFRMLAGQGVAVVETQTTESNEPCITLLKRLGFQEAGLGLVFEKRPAAGG